MEEISCPHCGQNHPTSLRYCPNTGAQLTRIESCPNCSNNVQENWAICAYCGFSLKEKEQPPKQMIWKWIAFLGGVVILAAIILLVVRSTTNIAETSNGPDSDQTNITSPPKSSLSESLILPVSEGTPVPQPVAAISPENAHQMVELARWGRGQIVDVAWLPNGKQLAVGSSSGIYFFDINTIRQIQFINTDKRVTSVNFSPNGEILASGSADGSLRLWDAATGQELHKLFGHTSQIIGVAYSPDGTTLASGSSDGSIKFWDAATGQELHSLTRKIGRYFSMVFSPSKSIFPQEVYFTIKNLDPKELGLDPNGVMEVEGVRGTFQELRAGIESGNTRIIWVGNTRLGRIEVQELRALDKNNQGDSNSSILATSSIDGSVKLWDAVSGQLLSTMTQHVGEVNDLAFYPDGSFLASGSGDVKYWDVETGRVLRILKGKNSGVFSLDFSSDGGVLASGSGEGSINLWDANTGRELHSLVGHTEIVDCVLFSPDGKFLVSDSRDGTIRLWGIPP